MSGASTHASTLFLTLLRRGAWLLWAVAATASADTNVPTKDAAGLADPSGLKRFTGSVLLYRDDVAYDELKLPAGKIQGDKPARTLDRAGQRTALQYLTPAGRSTLEVLRNYQQDLKAAGFDTAYECAGDACGGGNANIRNDDTLAGAVLPSTWGGKVGDNSAAACSAGSIVGDMRYALFDNKASGAAVAVMTWTPGILSVYCDEKEFQKRTGVMVVRVEPKAREQRMETLSASDMGKSLGTAGKVAIYGILFDTNKADIQPASKPSLDQIGALLKQQPTLRLHVVGHTDNVGTLPANLDLSRRRADAVAAALVRDYAVARDRLTANGVASLAPVQSNGDEAGRSKNRRVELVLQ